MSVTIREYRPDDAAATMRVFRRAVAGIASRDYDDEQIRVWSDHTGTPAAWNGRRMAAHTWVAERQGEVIGFIDVDDAGYVDMLFVDPACARQGVAARLFDQVERFAAEHGFERFTVHASITARRFFASRGFRTVKTRHPMIDGVVFTNYLMARP
ncbi:GNAT family N-acetyltransferase [Bifidobacterium amazonense]|uniref:GNAT family N-acetyltransferase n=1 Tax=Bifidobacterium amazonense TaxID=2809027 RepID=A0ABS9VXC5_9BIFI|nr:GNAT family N-acetyltransferase [Bifidobacterium amazonense]MCH9276718.1 GNAT family N-acetyltransferase [Bifidobacterium amazonense]